MDQHSAPDPAPRRTRAEASRLNGAKSRGPVTARGKRTSCKNAFKTGLHARSLASFPPEDQAMFREYTLLLTDTYHPEDGIELDLIHQLAMNRIRYHRIQRREAGACAAGEPLAALAALHRMLDSLERTYLRTLNTLDERRRKTAPRNQRVIVQWIDPRTGKPWLTDAERAALEAKTNPATPTKDEDSDPPPHPPLGHSALFLDTPEPVRRPAPPLRTGTYSSPLPAHW